ncbi:hypothetical protein GCM10010266_19780 [Streptomyces griseomycini]|nr:hypothetical protein GCM10010266_19780 [Streptomyces griseomycini]GGR06445.1 hypothetical protein GCM10015536_09160 [Streptomyces griseomycini]
MVPLLRPPAVRGWRRLRDTVPWGHLALGLLGAGSFSAVGLPVFRARTRGRAATGRRTGPGRI